jgi:hypothetical protein
MSGDLACIMAIKGDPENRTVQFDWDDGSRTAARFGYFEPDYFTHVSIGHKGRKLVWPDGSEMDADSLYIETHSRNRSELRFGHHIFSPGL